MSTVESSPSDPETINPVISERDTSSDAPLDSEGVETASSLHREISARGLKFQPNGNHEARSGAKAQRHISDGAATEPISEASTERFVAERRIGERIKYLRLGKQMGLVELGRHTGLSASFLSQLETGRVVPTLRNLARIAMVFSKDLNYFFEPEPRSLFRVQRAGERVRLPQTGADDPNYFFESLGMSVPDRPLDPFFAEFLPPKKGREPRPHQHLGTEFLYILSGQLEIVHGDGTHRLEADDAVYFDASVTHSYACVGETPCCALILTMQPQSGNGLSLPHRGSVERRSNERRIPPGAAVMAEGRHQVS
jgi:transcriptional regulator with XRE-family HTH domain